MAAHELILSGQRSGKSLCAETRDLRGAPRTNTAPNRLVPVDCLTLWLINLLTPIEGGALDDVAFVEVRDGPCDAPAAVPGRTVLVSNEIGRGITPVTREARRFVDAPGRLHQAVAAVCANVMLMVAAIELLVKRGGM